MNSADLQAFVLAADSGSMAAAARQLALSPATLKARIHALEENVGARLLQRVGRTVKPTEAGLRILTLSRGLLRDVQNLRSMANDKAPLGELRLGVSASASTGLMPPLLKRMYARHARLSVYVEPGTSPTLYHRLANDLLDAAVLVEPTFELPKALHWRPLVEEPLCLLVPASLAGRNPLKLLASQPYLCYDRSTWGGRLSAQFLETHGIEPMTRLEIDSLSALAAFVNQGLGISLVPDWTPPWPEGLKVAKLKLPGPRLVRRMGIAWVEGPRAALVGDLLEEAHLLWPLAA